MSELMSWIGNWRDPWHWVGAAASAALAWTRTRRSGSTRNPFRVLVAHINRERQHRETVMKLWRAEDDISSLNHQIDLLDHRIDGLLDLSSDGSLSSSPGRPRRVRRFPPPKSDSSGSTRSTGR